MKDQIARINMIKQQLRTNNISCEKVLALYDHIPRDAFVPEALKHVAYSDSHLPLTHNECMMTPLEEATILQALDLKGTETVLEIGTGTGFFTALLSHMSKEVISVDYFDEFTQSAREVLKTHGKQNITLITGDASQGWLDKAPYDVVVYTGALEKLSEMHRLQVIPGGKLFAVVGEAPLMRGELHTQDHQEAWQTKRLFDTNLPMLISHARTTSSKQFVF